MQSFCIKSQELVSSPINTEWIVEGQPEARSTVISTSGDGLAFIVIWECSPGKFHWRYTFDETMHLLEGSVTLDDGQGNIRTLGAGDLVFIPQGSRVTWIVHARVRKLAVCRKALPSQMGAAIKALRRLKALFSRAKAEPLFASPVNSKVPSTAAPGRA